MKSGWAGDFEIQPSSNHVRTGSRQLATSAPASPAPPRRWRRREAIALACPFFHPSDVESQPVIELKRFWGGMRETADIPDVRIHELRHTFASLLVSGGASLEMIGKLIDHTQIGTTQRYAHLVQPPLRAGVNAAGEMLRPRLKLVGE